MNFISKSFLFGTFFLFTAGSSLQAQPLCASDAVTVDPVKAPHLEKLDIVWVIDNSRSMEPHQHALSENLSGWVNGLVEQKIDFQVAVITTDGKTSSALTGPHALNSSTLRANREQFLKDFEKAIQVGIKGNGDEKHFDSALDFFEHKGNSFLRNDSNLTLLFLSDLDSKDASSTGSRRFAQTLLKYKDREHLQLFGILATHHRENFEQLNSAGTLPIEIFDLDTRSKQSPGTEMADRLNTISSSMATFSPVEITVPLSLAPTANQFAIFVNGVDTRPITPPQYDPNKKALTFSLLLTETSSIETRYSANCTATTIAATVTETSAPTSDLVPSTDPFLQTELKYKKRFNFLPTPEFSEEQIQDLFNPTRKVIFNVVWNQDTQGDPALYLKSGAEFSDAFQKLAKSKLFALAFADMYQLDRPALEAMATKQLKPNQQIVISIYYQRYEEDIDHFGSQYYGVSEKEYLKAYHRQSQPAHGPGASEYSAPQIRVDMLLMEDGKIVKKSVVRDTYEGPYGPGTGSSLITFDEVKTAMDDLFP